MLVGIIPCREGSSRFPGKHTALLRGKPLLCYTIEAALESKLFDDIVVFSSDQSVLSIAFEYEGVEAIKEPKNMTGSDYPVKKVCYSLLHPTGQMLKQDYTEFGVMLADNPLRKAEDLVAAYKLFREEDCNSVMSLKSYEHPPQLGVWSPDGYIIPYLEGHMVRSQYLAPLYYHDGSIIFSRVVTFLKEREFYGSRVLPFYSPPDRTVDVNYPEDLARVELLWKGDQSE